MNDSKKLINILIKTKERFKIMSTFAIRVKKILDEKKISQKDLSNMSGVSEASLCRYLKGKEPRMDIVENVSRALGVTKEHLLGEEDGPHDDPYHDTKVVLLRNKNQLTDEQKAKLIKLLYSNEE